ncbi:MULTISPECIES: peptide-methionine (S)-S-oxide reductase MsrA [Spirosoma]|uniref:Peptide methionine sulfoxide reductase MsrA n=1 Tax=Spirosoma sordidisoli TaxID=2502893 RepID=A0A4Q2UIS3_9BACT|nr:MULTISPECIES: peptide-methionine (S)-S-oxide reductase MsrA [Spirosoma]RYC69343.1 peptide-methionine (S)-S-oxide reductase [Spirosoma sordidisoli]
MTTTRAFLTTASLLVAALLMTGCQQQSSTNNSPKDTSPAKLPELQSGEAVATFAAGCFWCTEAQFESLRGVREVVSGYAGGELENPTYEQVGTDQTGHAESIQVYYDPRVIPFDTLVKAFFIGHDATSLNRQGPDVGTQYRSIAFYRTPAEKASIETAIRRENESGRYSRPVVTQVVPFRAFYPAEVYHQGYYYTHPDELYVSSVSTPKVEKFRERMASWLKKPN